MKLKLHKNEILVLRDVKADMTSQGGFKWPTRGRVVAPDWKDNDQCGFGLHGLPWGCGGDYRVGGPDEKWLVVRVCTAVGYRYGKGDLTDKCKFRKGTVVFCGPCEDVVALIAQYAPPNTRINWVAQITAGDGSTQTQYWWDNNGQYRAACRLVGKDEAGKAYRCEMGKWILVENKQADMILQENPK